MEFKEFQGRSRFGRDEILAYAQGSLVTGAPAPLPPLPGSLILPFHEISRIEWDEGSKTGRIEAVRDNRLDDWFYSCHFQGDPVMPGCWGIDAVWQALKFFAAWRGVAGCGKTLGMENVSFFGQIRPYDKKVVYVVDIVSIESSEGDTLVTGRASVAVDGMPVYTIGAAQVGTAFFESGAKTSGKGDESSAPDAPLTQRLSFDEFAARDRFSRAEILAVAQGNILDDPAVEMALLPNALMLEVGEIRHISYDGAAGEGAIVASRENGPLDWFYAMNHGLKPAALSIDSVWQLMGFFLAWRRNAGTGRALGFERVEVFDDIRPGDRRVRLELNITRTSPAPSSGDSFVRADAHVFADGRPILDCFNANVGCHRNIRYSDYPRMNEMALGGKLKTKKVED